MGPQLRWSRGGSGLFLAYLIEYDDGCGSCHHDSEREKGEFLIQDVGFLGRADGSCGGSKLSPIQEEWT